ncbi:hypothetical protein E1267_16590 [Nonomuraea longispora]|uniref:Beta-galactosidase trimerisation domain-containing protein n=1 Tax=Nonomuraea longispora TaxID=1848320 RepID=A0A4R4NBF3_9ACTN|nr:beta-galactosidase trimerization domain-containing protein [Nonomuraea longispora]TDC06371.1 hypothetical protein E1267_16590 [Nonomuraea longispora]
MAGTTSRARIAVLFDPGAFRELVGARIDEYWPARPHESFTVEFTDGRRATSTWWRDDLHLESGTALATYADGLLEGRAAVVENRYGAGRVVYVATLLEQAALDAVVLEAVESAGVRSRFEGMPARVACSLRGDEMYEYVFLLNHSGELRASVPLEGPGTDLLTGTPVARQVELGPLGAAVVQRPLRFPSPGPPAAGEIAATEAPTAFSAVPGRGPCCRRDPGRHSRAPRTAARSAPA